MGGATEAQLNQQNIVNQLSQNQKLLDQNINA
jgi:hypothetical protein